MKYKAIYEYTDSSKQHTNKWEETGKFEEVFIESVRTICDYLGVNFSYNFANIYEGNIVDIDIEIGDNTFVFNCGLEECVNEVCGALNIAKENSEYGYNDWFDFKIEPFEEKQNNLEIVSGMLLSDILEINGNSYEINMIEMINQIEDKGTLVMILKLVFEKELTHFAHKLAYRLDEIKGECK